MPLGIDRMFLLIISQFLEASHLDFSNRGPSADWDFKHYTTKIYSRFSHVNGKTSPQELESEFQVVLFTTQNINPHVKIKLAKDIPTISVSYI